ncbi:MAG TPA: hypothetical protein V6D12_07210 [Candidatus Obscuribacterales bacterium]
MSYFLPVRSPKSIGKNIYLFLSSESYKNRICFRFGKLSLVPNGAIALPSIRFTAFLEPA